MKREGLGKVTPNKLVLDNGIQYKFREYDLFPMLVKDEIIEVTYFGDWKMKRTRTYQVKSPAKQNNAGIYFIEMEIV